MQCVFDWTQCTTLSLGVILVGRSLHEEKSRQEISIRVPKILGNGLEVVQIYSSKLHLLCVCAWGCGVIPVGRSAGSSQSQR